MTGTPVGRRTDKTSSSAPTGAGTETSGRCQLEAVRLASSPPIRAWIFTPRGLRTAEKLRSGTFRNGNRDIWVVSADGDSEPRPVTTHRANDETSAWSPAGMWFVFESARGERGIWGIPATGGEPELLRQGNVGNIRWAPDSQTLFFWRPNDRDGNIWALSLDDRSERRVTDLIGRRAAMDGRSPQTVGISTSVGTRLLATSG